MMGVLVDEEDYGYFCVLFCGYVSIEVVIVVARLPDIFNFVGFLEECRAVCLFL